MNIRVMKYKNEKNHMKDLIKAFWLVHNDYVQSDEESEEDLSAWTKEGHELYFIEYENEYVGFVHMGSRGCDVDWLEDIFVLPKFQGKGIGSKVIEIMEEIVKQYSTCLYMEVAMHNKKVLHLYHKLGYDVLNTVTIRKDFNEMEEKGQETIDGLKFKVK